ncbi:F-box only protein 9 [Dendroctonus ponderosae]|uniref:F-box only protein 9 n=1 Tax=Dendroctonus ponderosae TaxID=77166 RepID=U4UJ00_DENPD|nr:F-box only protein 9 [Dendroctonus ponderosae]ERL94039.1 hypothetical protein D910_11322 [Dendroctonus ponderosae]
MDTNQTSRAGSEGTSGEAEGEEQEEPSSSTHQFETQHVEEELVSFRTRWKQEIESHPKNREQETVPSTPVKGIELEAEENIAKGFYITGTELEKAGKVYEAIQYYRKAVQLDPDIEHKIDYRPRYPLKDPETENSEGNVVTDESDSSEDSEVIEEAQLLQRIQKKLSKVGHFCIPKFTQSTTHISSLPIELLLYILKWVVSTDLDLRSLELFGSVCRGFYLCSRDSEIWRLACLRIWGLNCNLTPGEYGSWRNMFIDRPRLNFNGVYISKTTYIRHGENSFQDQFYRPWHLVSYFRYLRFFPEGMVLMLTSSDDPALCVNQLKTRNARAPVMVGYYRLKEDKVTIVVQRQETTKTVQSGFKKGGRRREIDNSEQTFHIELNIQNHKNRRHVKLVWSYYSVLTRSKQGHESTSNVDLIGNRFTNLWFSRVKSFTSESDQPLN